MFRNPAIPIKDGAGQYIDKPSTYFGNSIYDTFFGDGYNPVALAENTDRKKQKKVCSREFMQRSNFLLT